MFRPHPTDNCWIEIYVKVNNVDHGCKIYDYPLASRFPSLQNHSLKLPIFSYLGVGNDRDAQDILIAVKFIIVDANWMDSTMSYYQTIMPPMNRFNHATQRSVGDIKGAEEWDIIRLGCQVVVGCRLELNRSGYLRRRCLMIQLKMKLSLHWSFSGS